MKTLPLQAEDISQDTPLFKPNNLFCLSIGGRFEGDLIWATINHIYSYVHPENTKRWGGEISKLKVYIHERITLCFTSFSVMYY